MENENPPKRAGTEADKPPFLLGVEEKGQGVTQGSDGPDSLSQPIMGPCVPPA